MAMLLADHWPDAEVIGTDTSTTMLDDARANPGRVRWVEGDVRMWDPPDPPDIIYSNAVLHWVPDHDELLLRLLRSLRPGGILAVQMPLSWHEPSHRLMRTVLAEGGGRGPIGQDELRERIGRQPVASPGHYHQLLSGDATRLNVWQTTYYQQLQGEDAVLEWVKGSALRPITEGLDGGDVARFLDLYTSALADAYPPGPDGSTLYPFPRVFFVATR
jgi:trans-aconitate 2-methyltransferase